MAECGNYMHSAMKNMELMVISYVGQISRIIDVYYAEKDQTMYNNNIIGIKY